MSKDEKVALKLAKRKQRYEKFTNINKTRVITFVAYVLIVAVICLSSALQMMFDLEHFDYVRFGTNLCFSLSVAILSMVLSMKDGEITNDAKKKGDYYDIKVKFNEALKKIVDRDVFRQFCDVLYNRERKSYIDSNLSAVNLFNDNYMNVSDADLKILKTEPKVCVVSHTKDGKEITKPLDQINDVQYAMLQKYRNGKFKYPKLEYTFFTSRNNSNGYKYQASLQQRQHNVKILSMLYRCVYITIFSAIFALAVVNPNGSSAEQIAFDTISRLFTLASSMFFGYMVAHDEMKQNMDAMQYKIDIIEQFIVEKSTGSFKPIDMDEQILQKIAAKEAERQAEKAEEEAKKQAKEEKLVEIPKVEEPPKEEPTESFEITEEELEFLQKRRAESK